MENNFGYLRRVSLRSYLLVVGGIVAAFAILWMAPAYACGPAAAIAASDYGVEAGGSVNILGSSFDDTTPVGIHWDTEDGQQLGTGTPDASGHFAVPVTIPDVAPGVYTIFAVQPGTEGEGYVRSLQLTVLDNVAPAWPEGAQLEASDVTETGAQLSWPAADDAEGVTGYLVSRDGTEIADETGTTLTVAGLTAGTAYDFSVSAYDAAGNISETLATSVTTATPVTQEPVTEEPEPVEPPDTTTPDANPVTAQACPEERASTSGFTDIIGNLHQDAIECTAWYGIAQGTSATTYSPGQGVRRDQMASFLTRTLTQAGVTLPDVTTSAFTVIAGNPHAQAIAQLAELGIVQGTSATTYSPSKGVRRDQMASFLVRTLEHIDGTLATGTAPFTDIAGNTHAGAISAAYTAGLAQGSTATTYAPGQIVRRDQMASFLTRSLEHLVDSGHTMQGPAS